MSDSKEEEENENKWSNRKEYIAQDGHRLTPQERGMREDYLAELYEEFCLRHLSCLSEEQKTMFRKLGKPGQNGRRD